jgi:hypothetical protein
MNDYASIKIADGVTAQSGITTTPVLMTGWAINGNSFGAVPDHTSDNITIATTGTYKIGFQNSFSGTSSTTFEFHLRVDTGSGDVEQDEGCHRKLGTGGDIGSCSFPGILELTAGDILTIYVESDSGGGASMTPEDAQFTLQQIK